MPRVSEDEWTRKYGHGAFCHLAARTEGIMKEVIDGMLAGAVCVWEVALVFVTMLALYTGPLRVMTAEPIGLKTERLPRRSC